MSHHRFDTLLERLMAFAKQAKAVLSKDYSLHDFKNLRSLPSLLRQKLLNTKSSASGSKEVVYTQESWSIAGGIRLLSLTLTRYHQQSLIFLIICLLVLLNHFVVSPFNEKVQDQLEMRPAQWSALQSLIKLSKASINAKSSVGSDSFSLLIGSSAIAKLDEIELQKMRNILTARGMKPSVMRLTSDNPPRIEFQVSDTMFSVLLDSLEEFRINWHLYPEQLNIISSSGAGMVNVSGMLIQYGVQAEVSR